MSVGHGVGPHIAIIIPTITVGDGVVAGAAVTIPPVRITTPGTVLFLPEHSVPTIPPRPIDPVEIMDTVLEVVQPVPAAWAPTTRVAAIVPAAPTIMA